MDSNGTLPHYSCPYTSQQNGRAECKLRHILDVVRTLLISSSVAATTTLSLDLWHSRLGYTSLSRLQLLASQGHLGSVSFHKFDCMSCQFGKQTKLPFNNSDSFFLHLLTLFILMFGVLLHLPLRGDLAIL